MSREICFEVDRSSAASLSWQVEKDIEKQISDGLWAGQDKIPEERLLATLYGVSRRTIRKAIGNLCNRGLLVRRKARGTFIAGDKFAVQQAHESRTIMFVMGDLEVFARSVSGAEEEARGRGYGLTIGERTGDVPEKDRLYLRLAQERRVAGVLVEPSFLVAPEDYRSVRDSGIPMIFVEKEGAFEEDFVGGDNVGGMALLVHYLHGLGHERIGYVHHGRSKDRPTQPERLGGFVDACRNHGIEARDEWIVALGVLDGSGPEDEARVRAVLERPLDERPTALCCYNDSTATFVMRMALKAGLSIPDDVSIAGWDDSESQHPHLIPLTSLATASREIGVEAARLLFEKIEHGDTLTKQRKKLKPTLRIRVSTGPPPESVREAEGAQGARIGS